MKMSLFLIGDDLMGFNFHSNRDTSHQRMHCTFAFRLINKYMLFGIVLHKFYKQVSILDCSMLNSQW